MDPYLVATFWWGLLALSVLLTLIGLWANAWRMLLLAAVCSLAFAIAALASIGLLILLLTGGQLLSARLAYRATHSHRL